MILYNMAMSFYTKLQSSIRRNNSLLCVGLDPKQKPLFSFCKKIIDQTGDLVCAYKPNSAFFEAHGDLGIRELKKTIAYIQKKFPTVQVILDAKRGDIGSTNEGYISYAFDYLHADAITIHPYLGKDANQGYLSRKDKGVIVLCKTSNEGSDEFQNQSMKNGKPLYATVAKNVAQKWNAQQNCLLVVGATYPTELKMVRRIVGDEMFILVPGIGAQGGDLKATLKAGLNAKKNGLIINSARGIIFAKNPRDEAMKLRDAINSFRTSAHR